MSLKNRIERLEQFFKPKKTVPWGRIWEALREMDLKTLGVKNNKKFEKGFIERNGTKEDFIKKNEERRNF